MAEFDIILDRTIPQSLVVRVEAESLEEAEKIAMDIALDSETEWTDCIPDLPEVTWVGPCASAGQPGSRAY